MEEEIIVADWVSFVLTQEDINTIPEYAELHVGDKIEKFVYRTING